jgi:hypothetical protein
MCCLSLPTEYLLPHPSLCSTYDCSQVTKSTESETVEGDYYS